MDTDFMDLVEDPNKTLTPLGVLQPDSYDPNQQAMMPDQVFYDNNQFGSYPEPYQPQQFCVSAGPSMPPEMSYAAPGRGQFPGQPPGPAGNQFSMQQQQQQPQISQQLPSSSRIQHQQAAMSMQQQNSPVVTRANEIESSEDVESYDKAAKLLKELLQDNDLVGYSPDYIFCFEAPDVTNLWVTFILFSIF